MHPVRRHNQPRAMSRTTTTAMTSPQRLWPMHRAVWLTVVVVVLTVSGQLMTVHCASLNSNFDHLMQQEQNLLHQQQHQLQRSSSPATSTANAEPICSSADASKPYLTERAVLSSLTLELHPGQTAAGPCKTVLTAPESNVFIVRLHRTKPAPVAGKQGFRGSRNMDSGATMAGRNSTRSCPLSIISTSDPLKSPWKIDPCMMEDMTMGMSMPHEDPVKMLPGRLKIIWHHQGNAPNYRLIITSLGKGQSCLEDHKHACLRFGTDIMLCISDDLVCDGIRHCPTGNGYESDEDPEMCLRHKTNHPQHTSEMSLWKKISSELEKRNPSTASTTNTNESNSPSDLPTTVTTKVTTSQTAEPGKAAKEVRDRTSLTRGLSRYGPWGYLMLGMLLCGGALLMCGLWECCCRPKKPETPGDGPSIVATHSADNTTSSSSTTEPPNYDEIDPPPSYAVLFPNQKSDGAPSTSSQQPQPSANTATTTIASSTTTLLTSVSIPSGAEPTN